MPYGAKNGLLFLLVVPKTAPRDTRYFAKVDDSYFVQKMRLSFAWFSLVVSFKQFIGLGSGSAFFCVRNVYSKLFSILIG